MIGQHGARRVRDEVARCVTLAACAGFALVVGPVVVPGVAAAGGDDLSCLGATTEPVSDAHGERRERISVFNHCERTVRARIKVSHTLDIDCESYGFGARSWITGIGVFGMQPEFEGFELCD